MQLDTTNTLSYTNNINEDKEYDMSQINVIINNSNTSIEYDPADKQSLSQIMCEHNIILNTSCGSNGVCGKCIVYINNSTSPVKACTYYPDTDINVIIPNSSLLQTYNEKSIISNSPRIKDNTIYCAIDIGSTSITVCFVNKSDIIATETFYNSTRQAGSDVISRIQSACKGNLDKLTALLRSDIINSMTKLLNKCHIDPDCIAHITIACNSTMQHLFTNMDCSGLCSYPFKPYRTQFDDFYVSPYKCPVSLIPSFSAFIGGDIISGLYSLNANEDKSPFILLDLGTNAEIVLGTGSDYLCTSAAAGPAFEASGLSHGCPGVAGAINNINIRCKSDGSYNITYKTIGDKHPVGICGSGVLCMLSDMLHNDIIDSYGTFTSDDLDEFIIARTPSGNISITQEDIRKLQLAISAIRTGIELLISHSDISINELKRIYISGSFGSSLDMHRISNLKLLPAEWLDDEHTIIYAGNTSLNGAIKYSRLIQTEATSTTNIFKDITDKCHELELNSLPEFNNTYLNNINF